VAWFILLVLAIVVAQVFSDWRRTHHGFPLAGRDGALAVGAVFAAAMATGISLFEQKTAGEWPARTGSGLFWLQLLFTLVTMGIIAFAVRKKRPPIIIALAAILLGALCLSLVLFT
jgi:ABC-type Fe3+-siderophore transport system permease subunit